MLESVSYMIELYSFVFIAQFLGFIIKGMAGFGNPLLTNPLLAMKIDNIVITPTNILLDLPVNAWISWQKRKDFQWRTVLPLVFWIIIGILPGTLLLKLGTPWVIKVVLGIFIIGLGIEMLLRNPLQKNMPKTWLRNGISFASGIMAGLFGINLLFLAYLERVSANRDAFQGSVCFVFLIENVLRAGIYYWYELFTMETILFSLISIPAAILGVCVGVKVTHFLSERQSKYVAISLFLLGGISILVKAILTQS